MQTEGKVKVDFNNGRQAQKQIPSRGHTQMFSSLGQSKNHC